MVPSVDMTIEISRSSSSSSWFQMLPPYCWPSASISTAARSGPVSLRLLVRSPERLASAAMTLAISCLFSA